MIFPACPIFFRAYIFCEWTWVNNFKKLTNFGSACYWSASPPQHFTIRKQHWGASTMVILLILSPFILSLVFNNWYTIIFFAENMSCDPYLQRERLYPLLSSLIKTTSYFPFGTAQVYILSNNGAQILQTSNWNDFATILLWSYIYKSKYFW